MRVVLRSVNSLKPYKANPRINDQAVDAVARSIREFGFRQPIVIDGKDVIIVGHTRWKAAQKLGLKKVPVHVAADLSEAQKRAYRIADNQTADLADWNYELLAQELGELGGVDFDLQALGFPADQLGALLEPELKDGLTDPDAVPLPPDAARTRRGDLYILGEHRLVCGDASDAADVDRLLDGARIQLVNTDPPYNVKLEPATGGADTGGQRPSWRSIESQAAGHVRPERKNKVATRLAKARRLAGDFVSDAQFDKLLRAWFGQVARALEPGRAFYIWGGYANLVHYPEALAENGLHFAQQIIWVKQHPVLTRKDFMGNHEWCFYGWRKGAGHWFAFGRNNVRDVWEIGTGQAEDAEQLDVGTGMVLEAPSGARLYVTPKVPKGRHGQLALAEGAAATLRTGSPTDIWRVKKIPPQKMIHLTEKPVELAVRAMQCSSRIGENVLDLFGGSGSTMIAAERGGRRCFTMELDELYCDVIVRRWEEFTGQKAERQAARPERRRTRRKRCKRVRSG